MGLATIMVRLSNSWGQTVTVDYATSDGSANGWLECGSVVDDYEITSGQLTFSPGETSRTFSVTICDDDIPNEPDLTVNLTLSNAHNADLGTSSATLVIVDDEHVVQFSSATYNVNENSGSATIMVTLNPASPQTVTVDYAIGNGTAYGTQLCGLGGDYIDEIISPTLTFPPNSTSQTFDVEICDDSVYEGAETVGLALSNPINAYMGLQQTATLTIVDDEPQPFIGFSSSNYSVYENTGPATITVTLNVSLPISVSVDYATSPGTATAGLSCQTDMDYVSISDTLTIPANSTSGIFNVTICEVVPTPEPTETLTLTLSNPIGVPLGTLDSAILQILDN